VINFQSIAHAAALGKLKHCVEPVKDEVALKHFPKVQDLKLTRAHICLQAGRTAQPV
jgi:hypothetical protein